MVYSTLTTKYQATIPAEIRDKLELHAGDKICFECDNGRVYIVKLKPFDLAYHQALEMTLSEWNSTEDDEAFRDL